MSERAMEYARLASTLVGLLMCFACWRWKNIGRLLFVVLFVWAGQINLRTALSNPTDYLNYARLAPVAAYRDFILGPFARHIAWFVVPVALGQLAIALFIALRGEAYDSDSPARGSFCSPSSRSALGRVSRHRW